MQLRIINDRLMRDCMLTTCLYGNDGTMFLLYCSQKIDLHDRMTVLLLKRFKLLSKVIKIFWKCQRMNPEKAQADSRSDVCSVLKNSDG